MSQQLKCSPLAAKSEYVVLLIWWHLEKEYKQPGGYRMISSVPVSDILTVGFG